MSPVYLLDDDGRIVAEIAFNGILHAVPLKVCSCCRIRIVQAARTPAQIIRAQQQERESL